jgi:hypothetical protein
MDTPMVSTTAATMRATGVQPSSAIWPTVMRRPSKATPVRSTWRAANSMPAAQGPPSDRKFIAVPSSRANSITGAP